MNTIAFNTEARHLRDRAEALSLKLCGCFPSDPSTETAPAVSREEARHHLAEIVFQLDRLSRSEVIR